MIHPADNRHSAIAASIVRNNQTHMTLLKRWFFYLSLLAAGMAMCATLTSCEDDVEDTPDTYWYVSGSYQSNYDADEVMNFYSNGTGYWESLSTGDYLDFDYYCWGNNIYFTFLPDYQAPYTMMCGLTVYRGGDISITWPADSFYGPVTIYYSPY